MNGNPPGWDDPDRRDDALERLLLKVARAPLVPEEHLGQISGTAKVDRLPNLGELQVLEAFSHGLGYKSVGVVLNRSLESVKSQAKHARFLLRAKNTTEACCEAIRLGLIP